jgi:hypothetical protein
MGWDDENVLEMDLIRLRFAPTGQLYVSPGQRHGERENMNLPSPRGGGGGGGARAAGAGAARAGEGGERDRGMGWDDENVLEVNLILLRFAPTGRP